MGRHSKPGPEDDDPDVSDAGLDPGQEPVDEGSAAYPQQDVPEYPPVGGAPSEGFRGPTYAEPDTADQYGYTAAGQPADSAGPADQVGYDAYAGAGQSGGEERFDGDSTYRDQGDYADTGRDSDEFGYADGRWDQPGRHPDQGGHPDEAGYPDERSYPESGYPAYPGAGDYPGAARYPGERDFPDDRRYSDEPVAGADHPDQAYYPGAGDYVAPGGDEYPDFGSRPDSSALPPSDSSSLPPPSLFQAGHREDGEAQAGHRSASGRRGVSIGVIVALVTVVVVVAGVIAWRFIGDALSHRSHSAAARCVGGKDSVAVITDPSIVDPIKQLADSYNASAGPIGDRCVTVSVKSAGSDAVISGLVGKWPADLGAQPGLWIPGSSVSSARLAGVMGKQSISDSRSLVTTPVLLAIRP